eukprot:2881456-Prymnesium_polylepis.1
MVAGLAVRLRRHQRRRRCTAARAAACTVPAAGFELLDGGHIATTSTTTAMRTPASVARPARWQSRTVSGGSWTVDEDDDEPRPSAAEAAATAGLSARLSRAVPSAAASAATRRKKPGGSSRRLAQLHQLEAGMPGGRATTWHDIRLCGAPSERLAPLPLGQSGVTTRAIDCARPMSGRTRSSIDARWP